jgi:hypothetical protein
MTHAARSVQIYGVYLLISGLAMCFVPNAMLGRLGVAPTTEGYIRMLGLVLAILALYYVAAARARVVPFFRWSVWGRALAVVGMIGLMIGGFAPTAFLGIAVVDAAAAVWTALALRRATAAAA